MNGDGFLDQVDALGCNAGNRVWAVRIGNPNGFDEQVISWSLPGVNGDCAIRRTRYSDSGNNAITEFDTLDINGDGIPDFVDARQQPWHVYLGQRPEGSAGWGFATTPISWQASVTDHNGATFNGLRGSRLKQEWLDLVDWNGDGLADLVNAKEARVYRNLGDGFEISGIEVVFPDDRLGRTQEGRRLEALRDINGDGLPDFIRASAPANGMETWVVYLNQGRALGLPQVWSFPSGCTWGISRWSDHSINSGAVPPQLIGYSNTSRDLIDINGDGLPDIVESCNWQSGSREYWDVRLNQGTRLRQDLARWDSPVRWIARERECTPSTSNRCTLAIADFGAT